MRSEHSGADKRNRVPVRSRDVIDRKQKIKNENGRSKPEQKQDFELLIHPTPTCQHRPTQSGKEQRRIKNKMFAEKFQRLERTEPNILLEIAAGSQMSQGDPGVLSVPDD